MSLMRPIGKETVVWPASGVSPTLCVTDRMYLQGQAIPLPQGGEFSIGDLGIIALALTLRLLKWYDSCKTGLVRHIGHTLYQSTFQAECDDANSQPPVPNGKRCPLTLCRRLRR
jgi:hypothetical protein